MNEKNSKNVTSINQCHSLEKIFCFFYNQIILPRNPNKENSQNTLIFIKKIPSQEDLCGRIIFPFIFEILRMTQKY